MLHLENNLYAVIDNYEAKQKLNSCIMLKTKISNLIRGKYKVWGVILNYFKEVLFVLVMKKNKVN
jgi:hypothetical protein